MRVVLNSFIPFRGFIAITLWPFIFVRKSVADNYTFVDDRHEHIHGRQQLEMLILPFLLWYIIEWLVRLIVTHDFLRAYRSISFEREAYENEYDEHYLSHRRPYAWLRYLVSS